MPLKAFRGLAPRFSPEKLPDGYAQKAVSARLMSGALEAWRSDAIGLQPVVKAGTIQSIHLMDIDGSDGGPYLLHWTADVDVIRGPVPGDVTERTYYTGDEYPKVTNLELATGAPPVGAAGAYPYRWLRLGIAGPDVAPDLVLQIDTPAPGDVPIENQGAESGITGWTVTAGDLLSVTTAPHSGNHCFEGGNAADTEAYQGIFLTDVGLITGQTITLQWWAKGTDFTAMGLRFYDSLSNLIGETFVDLAAAGAIWVQTDGIDAVIPPNTVTVRLVQKFQRVAGAGILDAFIDDITLTSTNASISYDGSSLSDFLTSASGSATVEIDSANGWPAPSFKFMAVDDDTVSMYRDFQVSDSPKYTVDFECFTTAASVIQGPAMRIVLNADAAGTGTQIVFTSEGVFLQNTASWATNQSSSVKIGTGNYYQVQYKVHIEVDGIATGKKSVTISTKKSADGSQIDSITTEIQSYGNYVGFKATSGTGGGSTLLDNIQFVISPQTSNSDGNPFYTNYVFTYVDSLSEESKPSPVSRTVQLGDDTTVLITTPTVGPAGYDVTLKRIYRAVTGATDTVYRLVAEIPLAQAEYLDTATDEDLEDDILESDGWDVPPEDGHSITAAANGITYIASKNQVFASPVNRPHAYPALWARTTDYPVVGLATIATDLYVLTQERPYIVTGSDPSALFMDKLKKPIGCVSKRSITVMMPYGVVYASSDGLSYANSADVDYLTRDLYTEREWNDLTPSSILGCTYDGMYVGFSTTAILNEDGSRSPGGFVISPGPAGFGAISLDFFATAVFINPLTGNLHMVVGGVHLIFNTGAALRGYLWQSQDFTVDRPTNLAWAKLDMLGAGPVEFRLYYDSVLVHTAEITDSGKFMLPMSDGSGNDLIAEDTYSYSISGTAKIRGIIESEAS